MAHPFQHRQLETSMFHFWHILIGSITMRSLRSDTQSTQSSLRAMDRLSTCLARHSSITGSTIAGPTRATTSSPTAQRPVACRAGHGMNLLACRAGHGMNLLVKSFFFPSSHEKPQKRMMRPQIPDKPWHKRNRRMCVSALGLLSACALLLTIGGMCTCMLAPKYGGEQSCSLSS